MAEQEGTQIVELGDRSLLRFRRDGDVWKVAKCVGNFMGGKPVWRVGESVDVYRAVAEALQLPRFNKDVEQVGNYVVQRWAL